MTETAIAATSSTGRLGAGPRWALGTLLAALVGVAFVVGTEAWIAWESGRVTQSDGQYGLFQVLVELGAAAAVAACWGYADGRQHRTLLGVVVRWTLVVIVSVTVDFLAFNQVIDVSPLADAATWSALMAIPYVGGAVAGWIVATLARSDPDNPWRPRLWR